MPLSHLCDKSSFQFRARRTATTRYSLCGENAMQWLLRRNEYSDKLKVTLVYLHVEECVPLSDRDNFCHHHIRLATCTHRQSQYTHTGTKPARADGSDQTRGSDPSEQFSSSSNSKRAGCICHHHTSTLTNTHTCSTHRQTTHMQHTHAFGWKRSCRVLLKTRSVNALNITRVNTVWGGDIHSL